MTTNVKNYAVGAVESVHYARLDEVTEDYPAGATGTIANASDESMLTYKGFATYSETPANAESVAIQGDAGNLGEMFVRAIESATGSIGFATANLTFQGIAEDLTIHTDGDHEKVGVDDACTVLNPIDMIINSHATSLEAASLNEQGWEVREIHRTTAELGDGSLSGTDFAAQPQNYNLVMSNTTKDMDNRAILNAEYGRTKLRGKRYWSENPVIRHTLLGDAAVVTVTLQETPAAEDGDKVKVYIDGVAQDYTTDFTVVASTKVLTFVAAPAAGEVVIITYEYLASC